MIFCKSFIIHILIIITRITISYCQPCDSEPWHTKAKNEFIKDSLLKEFSFYISKDPTSVLNFYIPEIRYCEKNIFLKYIGTNDSKYIMSYNDFVIKYLQDECKISIKDSLKNYTSRLLQVREQLVVARNKLVNYKLKNIIYNDKEFLEMVCRVQNNRITLQKIFKVSFCLDSLSENFGIRQNITLNPDDENYLRNNISFNHITKRNLYPGYYILELLRK